MLFGVTFFAQRSATPTPVGSVNSRLFIFQRLIFGSASPLLLLVFVILMAASCARSAGATCSGISPDVGSPVGNSKNISSKNGLLSEWGVENVLKPFCRWDLVGKGIPKQAGFKNGKNGLLTHEMGCGDITCLYICSKPVCAKPHYGEIRCKKRDCPTCYPGWLIRSSDSITARLLSEPCLAIHKGLRLGEAYLSIPIKKYPTSMAAFKVLRKEANAYALSIGFVGGFMVSHQFRTTEHAKDMAYVDNVSKWDWVRDQEDWRAHVKLSYHFHVIGFFTWFKKQKKDQNEDWNYESVTDQDNNPVDLLKELEPEKRLKGRFKYLLSHTAVPKEEAGKFRTFNYFGSCSYNKFGVTEEERAAMRTGEPPVRYCKLCSSELMLAWDWIRVYYASVQNGDIEEPEYFFEIQDFMNGEPPPGNVNEFLIDDPSNEEGNGG